VHIFSWVIFLPVSFLPRVVLFEVFDDVDNDSDFLGFGCTLVGSIFNGDNLSSEIVFPEVVHKQVLGQMLQS
jgi:hypothetical protein